MSGVLSVPVRAPSGPYEVLVGRDLLDAVGTRLLANARPRTAFMLTDSEVAELYSARVLRSLEREGLRAVEHVVSPGEPSKSWSSAGDVLETMAREGVDRRDVVVTLGGGVVGDLGGFCASCYMRGIGVVHVPTTLLAQVDASVGGKTAVDLEAGKNLAGTFWQPLEVVADTSTLETLPDTEWRSGLAEVAKTAFLQGGDALSLVEQDASALVAREPDAVERTVAMCVAFKASVVTGDERESGGRECLNYGHTLGHAIEQATGYGTVPHGLAVAEGMRFAAALAEETLEADPSTTARQAALLDVLGLPRLDLAWDVDALLSAMASDKKATGGAVRFVLLAAPGEWSVGPVPDDVIERRLRSWASPGELGE